MQTSSPPPALCTRRAYAFTRSHKYGNTHTRTYMVHSTKHALKTHVLYRRCNVRRIFMGEYSVLVHNNNNKHLSERVRRRRYTNVYAYAMLREPHTQSTVSCVDTLTDIFHQFIQRMHVPTNTHTQETENILLMYTHVYSMRARRCRLIKKWLCCLACTPLSACLPAIFCGTTCE